MTLKLIDLQDFAKHVRNRIYPSKEIHINKLRLLIAEKFGISDYVQKNIVDKMIEFGMIKSKNINLFELKEDKHAPKQS